MPNSVQPCAIDPVWQGERVFILGGGPSLADMDLRPLHSKKVLGVNSAFTLGDWVDAVWALDDRWVEWNWDALCAFPGLKLFGTSRLFKVPPGGRRILRDPHKQGILTAKRDTIHPNSSSGASAINVAVHLGAKEIVLLGFDMKTENGKHNWHSYHQHRPKDTIYVDTFLKPFYYIKQDLEHLGIRCINATPGSALNAFERVALEELI